MAYMATGSDKEWLSKLSEVLDSETLLRNRDNDEILTNELANNIGFPIDQDNFTIIEFWDGIICSLRSNGYKIVDELYLEEQPDNTEENKEIARKLQEAIVER